MIGDTIRIHRRLFTIIGTTKDGRYILVDDEGNRMVYGRAW